MKKLKKVALIGGCVAATIGIIIGGRSLISWRQSVRARERLQRIVFDRVPGKELRACDILKKFSSRVRDLESSNPNGITVQTAARNAVKRIDDMTGGQLGDLGTPWIGFIDTVTSTDDGDGVAVIAVACPRRVGHFRLSASVSRGSGLYRAMSKFKIGQPILFTARLESNGAVNHDVDVYKDSIDNVFSVGLDNAWWPPR